jgi:hypothetical protein
MKARKVSKQGYTPTYIRDQYKEIRLNKIEEDLLLAWNANDNNHVLRQCI